MNGTEYTNGDTTTDRTTTRERTGSAPRLDYDREAAPTGSPSIPTLLKTLSKQSSTLVREEVALAKSEFSEKLDVLRSSMIRMMVATGLLLAGVLLIMAAVNNGLTALLEGPLGLETAVWLSPLILGVVTALVAYALFKSATASMKEEGVVPHETVETLKEDKDWAERRVRA